MAGTPLLKLLPLLLLLCTAPVPCSGRFIFYVGGVPRPGAGGVNQNTIQVAVAAAKASLQIVPGETVEVVLPSGTYDIDTTEVCFDLSDINPSEGASFIIRGGGIDSTTLRFDGKNDVIVGSNLNRVVLRDITFGRQARSTTTQGTVVNATGGSVTLRIDEGFPSVSDVMCPHATEGRYIRRYRKVSGKECQLVTDDSGESSWPPKVNPLLVWTDAVQSSVDHSLWTLQVNLSTEQQYYTAGTLVGVRSVHDHTAYALSKGTDIEFLRVRWTGHSSGVIRNMSNVRFSGCAVDHPSTMGQVAQCLATNAGGPQIGHPDDPPIQNVTIENFMARGTGDDAIALHKVESGGLLQGVTISDSFARGILLGNCNESAVVLKDVHLTRCPVDRESG